MPGVGQVWGAGVGTTAGGDDVGTTALLVMVGTGALELLLLVTGGV